MKYKPGDRVWVKAGSLGWDRGRPRSVSYDPGDLIGCTVAVADASLGMVKVDPDPVVFLGGWWVMNDVVHGLIGPNLAVGPQPFNVTINIKPSGACCTRCKEFNPYQEAAFECYQCRTTWGWMPKEA